MSLTHRPTATLGADGGGGKLDGSMPRDYDPFQYSSTVPSTPNRPPPTVATPTPSSTGGSILTDQQASGGGVVIDTTSRVSRSGSSSSSRVNPATIPLRSSSIPDGSSTSPPKVPRRYSSMASVPEERRRQHQPEVDERAWLAQGRRNRATMGSPPPTAVSQASSMAGGAKPSSPPDLTKELGAELTGGRLPRWSAEKEKILQGPFDYLESHPGKDVRTQLISAFDAWLQVPAASLRVITRVVTMLHTASLLIDDVEDNSQLRRGVPVAHSIFGTAQTINSANYVYFGALQELLQLGNPAAVQIYTDELVNLHRGQGMDLFWRDTLTCPSEDDYLEMVGNKTGGLFRLAVKLMCAESSPQAASPSHPLADDYLPLVNTIGLLFQILDDYRNLADTDYTRNKGLCEDLTEGKFSFPILHALRADPSSLVLVNILRQRTTDDEVKRYAVRYMEQCGSFAYTRRVLRGLTRKALRLVDELDAGRGQADGVRTILERLRVDRATRQSGSS